MAQTVVQNALKVKTVVTNNAHNAKIKPSARRVNKTSNLIKSWTFASPNFHVMVYGVMTVIIKSTSAQNVMKDIF